MNKNIWIIIGVIIGALAYWGISKDQEEAVREQEKTISYDLNGTWGLTNYFDTIEVHRELAKYRVQKPTWSAILLEIENDSLRNYGSIINAQYAIDQTKDTLTTLLSDVAGVRWYLVQQGDVLKLIKYPGDDPKDQTEYIYRRREDLSPFTKDKKSPFIIGESVTNYFNRKLLKGKYINQDTQEEVVFGENGQLTGLKDFTTYKVRNYFGTLHMHKNKDVVTFEGKGKRKHKQYNWVFSGDELTLIEFVNDKVTGDYFILGEEKIRLKKKGLTKISFNEEKGQGVLIGNPIVLLDDGIKKVKTINDVEGSWVDIHAKSDSLFNHLEDHCNAFKYLKIDYKGQKRVIDGRYVYRVNESLIDTVLKNRGEVKILNTAFYGIGVSDENGLTFCSNYYEPVILNFGNYSGLIKVEKDENFNQASWNNEFDYLELYENDGAYDKIMKIVDSEEGLLLEVHREFQEGETNFEILLFKKGDEYFARYLSYPPLTYEE